MPSHAITAWRWLKMQRVVHPSRTHFSQHPSGSKWWMEGSYQEAKKHRKETSSHIFTLSRLTFLELHIFTYLQISLHLTPSYISTTSRLHRPRISQLCIFTASELHIWSHLFILSWYLHNRLHRVHATMIKHASKPWWNTHCGRTHAIFHGIRAHPVHETESIAHFGCRTPIRKSVYIEHPIQYSGERMWKASYFVLYLLRA